MGINFRIKLELHFVVLSFVAWYIDIDRRWCNVNFELGTQGANSGSRMKDGVLQCQVLREGLPCLQRHLWGQYWRTATMPTQNGNHSDPFARAVVKRLLFRGKREVLTRFVLVVLLPGRAWKRRPCNKPCQRSASSKKKKKSEDF